MKNKSNPSDIVKGLRAELAVRRHERDAQTRNALEMRDTIIQLRTVLQRLWTTSCREWQNLNLQPIADQQKEVLAALQRAGGIR